MASVQSLTSKASTSAIPTDQGKRLTATLGSRVISHGEEFLDIDVRISPPDIKGFERQLRSVKRLPANEVLQMPSGSVALKTDSVAILREFDPFAQPTAKAGPRMVSLDLVVERTAVVIGAFTSGLLFATLTSDICFIHPLIAVLLLVASLGFYAMARVRP